MQGGDVKEKQHMRRARKPKHSHGVPKEKEKRNFLNVNDRSIQMIQSEGW